MNQLQDYADTRLILGCIYCGGLPDTRDHVPSKCLLDRPFPENLPVVGCCDSCNQKFSRDEQYLVCLIESVLSGSTEPEKIGRPSVAEILKKSPGIGARIESSKIKIGDDIAFVPELERLNNVMLKLARGHAAFELSQICRDEPDHFWSGPLLSLPEQVRESFEEAHFQHNLGEVGSRSMQRMMIIQTTVLTESGEQKNISMIMNDWIEVQEKQYRYLAAHDMGRILIRIVIAEYLACEVAWDT